jgi:hypothetical protein
MYARSRYNKHAVASFGCQNSFTYISCWENVLIAMSKLALNFPKIVLNKIPSKLCSGNSKECLNYLRTEGILRKIPRGYFEKNSKNETFAPKLSQSECQWYHLKACLKSFTMSTTNVEGF